MFINQALLAAWNGACKVAGATVKVPPQLKFLIKPVTFQGPCMPGLTLQVLFHFLFLIMPKIVTEKCIFFACKYISIICHILQVKMFNVLI